MDHGYLLEPPQCKGVVAGPASAETLFLAEYLVSAVSLFFAVLAISVVLTCDIIPSNHQKCHVLLIRLSLTLVMACVIIDIAKV